MTAKVKIGEITFVIDENYGSLAERLDKRIRNAH